MEIKKGPEYLSGAQGIQLGGPSLLKFLDENLYFKFHF